MLPDVEMVAEKVHESWMSEQRRRRIHSRKAEDGEELMVPYSELSEEQKEIIRTLVRTLHAAIEALG